MKRPLHAADVAPETWYAGTDREIRGRALCDVGGRAKVGVGQLELPPGSNTRPGHWHSDEEEHLYVLAGSALLHLGDERHRLVAGDYACFPAGQAVPHHLENDGDVAFVYLMIGERIAGDRVTWPEGDD
jgi:uncharacterized cupin superfamily protein